MSRYVLWLLSMLGTMIGLALLSGVLIGLMIASPRAQDIPPGPGDFGFHHDLNHDWYQHLKQPGTGYSCCNGTANGVVGDCRPTKAKKIGDTWWALIDGEYERVPPNLVIKSDQSKEPYQAHICATRSRTIYCFIEKEGGT